MDAVVVGATGGDEAEAPGQVGEAGTFVGRIATVGALDPAQALGGQPTDGRRQLVPLEPAAERVGDDRHATGTAGQVDDVGGRDPGLAHVGEAPVGEIAVECLVHRLDGTSPDHGRREVRPADAGFAAPSATTSS